MLLGASRVEAKARIPEIEDFTELGNFLALPVRTYSAGMQTRLTFAVATAAHPEILLMDEVIGTGDSDFQAKARKRMNGFIEKSSVFVLASHSQELIQSFCNKICTLDHGRLVREGMEPRRA
jgi:ABC-type polysaccharide/polyol phosphate transport system ATPase subunit